jgi:hypothetical protein
MIIKKYFVLLVILSFSLSTFAQLETKAWYISVGTNAINSLGTQSPINSPDDWAFGGIPISIAGEFSFSDNFTIEQSASLNKFSIDKTIDGAQLNDAFDYLSFDARVNYYFGQYIFPKTDWLDIFANVGVGFFHIDNSNFSANVGGGVVFWLNKDNSFGLKAHTIAKAAFDHSNSQFNNNHFQYHLQAIIRL